MAFIKGHSFRHILYEQKGGYLLLPLVLMLLLGTTAYVLPRMEVSSPTLAQWAERVAHLPPADPGMAQIILGAVAGSCITVVSIVYSVLLIALTFASIQFSPRVLIGFLRDRVSQLTLGLFIGTFAYCLILLPSIQVRPASVPTLSLLFAIALATACLFVLIYFIQHIALSIQVNYIISRISRETEFTLRTIFGEPLKGYPASEEPLQEPSGSPVPNFKSGYVQYIDERKLLQIAISNDLTIYIHRSVGQFIPAGVTCLTIAPFHKATPSLKMQCLECFHFGPLRSMELDVEFGVLQLVDIALKAISPAVNDPSTAIACIDHLSGILLLSATLEPPSARLLDESGTVRLLRRQTSFPRLLDIAFDQIIVYARSDMAVSLRLMRALHDISGVTNYPPFLSAIRRQAQIIAKACTASFPEESCRELLDRLHVIETRKRSA